MRDRDHFSAISHLIGAALSMFATLVLIILAVQKKEPWQIVGFAIFGASVLLLYTTSSLYHFFHVSSRVRHVFQRLDHSFIFILIAGTYTPVCLTVLRGPWGWTLLCVMWSLAIIGIVVKNIWRVPPMVSTMYYVLLGWIALIPIVPLYRALPFIALLWLFLGGILYTVGAFFYALDDRFPSHSWFNHHDTFHLFVIGGSLCHFVLMFYLL